MSGRPHTFRLTLRDAARKTVVFTDRPARKVGTEPVADFVARWKSRGFDKDPPNAALEVAGARRNADVKVLELRAPRFDARSRTLRFTVRDLGDTKSTALSGLASREDSAIPGRFGRASLFVDSGADEAAGMLLGLTAKGDASADLNFTSGTIASLSSYSLQGKGLVAEDSSSELSMSCQGAPCILFATVSLSGGYPVAGTATITGGVLGAAVGGSKGKQKVPNGKFSLSP